MFDRIYIFCPTYKSDDKWSQIDEYVKSGKVKVFPVVKNSLLLEIWSIAKKKKENGIPYQTLIICDDCMGQDDFRVDSPKGILNSLVCKGNHDNVSLIWNVQKITLCSTIMRTQVEVIIVFDCQQDKELKTIYQELGVGTCGWFTKMLRDKTSTSYHYVLINRQGPGRADIFHNRNKIEIPTG